MKRNTLMLWMVILSILLVSLLGCKKGDDATMKRLIEENSRLREMQESLLASSDMNKEEKSLAANQLVTQNEMTSENIEQKFDKNDKVEEFAAKKIKSSKKAVSSNRRRATGSVKDTSLQNIKRLYNQGQFSRIMKTSFSRTELNQLYYKALSFYNAAIQTKKKSLKPSYANQSKEILKKIAKTTKDPVLSSRSILWYGIVNFRFPSADQTIEDLSDPFLFLQKNFTDSRVHNDAILYAGMVYHKEGNSAYARSYYEALRNYKNQNDLVYDFRKNKMVTPAKAAQYYLDLLDATDSTLAVMEKKQAKERARKRKVATQEQAKNKPVVGLESPKFPQPTDNTLKTPAEVPKPSEPEVASVPKVEAPKEIEPPTLAEVPGTSANPEVKPSMKVIDGPSLEELANDPAAPKGIDLQEIINGNQEKLSEEEVLKQTLDFDKAEPAFTEESKIVEPSTSGNGKDTKSILPQNGKAVTGKADFVEPDTMDSIILDLLNDY